MVKKCWAAVVAVAATVAAGPAYAAPTIFFGEDQNANGTFVPAGNSANARSAFLGNLSSGVGTENFESIPAGSGSPLNLTFPGSTGNIGATLTGANFFINSGAGAGYFPSSGSKYLTNVTAGFTLDFSAPIAAFGFFGMDVGDILAQLTLTLTEAGTGVTSNVVVPHTIGGNNGSLLFFGFTDTSTSYSRITFNTTTSNDVFAFDDLTIGDLQQVQPSGVPEPGTLALLMTGGVGLVGGAIRRRRKATV